MSVTAVNKMRKGLLVNITQNIIFLRSEDKLDFKFDNPLKCLPFSVNQDETTAKHIDLRSLFINGSDDDCNVWYTDVNMDADSFEKLSTDSIAIINDTLQEIADEKVRICAFIIHVYAVNFCKITSVGFLSLKEPIKIQHKNMFLNINELVTNINYRFKVCLRSGSGLGNIIITDLSIHNLELIENHLKKLYY